MELDWSARALGIKLGLGDLGNTDSPCHGFQNACVCCECVEREQAPLTASMPVRQPWETAA